MDLNVVIFALLGGVLPSFVWLWFWLREDRKNPEPTGAIVRAFIAGALTVPFAIWLENWVKDFFESSYSASMYESTLVFTWVILLWALIEEFLKFLFAYLSSLSKSYNDEPIDSLIYMITVALGFAALENFLFLLGGAEDAAISSLLTGNFRFLGATLLHILASSVVGAALAFSFRRKRRKTSLKQKLFTVSVVAFSIVLATLLHFAFNYSISVMEMEIFKVFAFVWLGLLAILIIFEKIKRIKY